MGRSSIFRTSGCGRPSLGSRRGRTATFALTWDDTSSGRLPQPRSRRAGGPNRGASATADDPARLRAPPSEPGRSRSACGCPAAVCRSSRSISTSAAARPALRPRSSRRVWRAAKRCRSMLGGGMLRRVVQGELAAAALRVRDERRRSRRSSISSSTTADNPPSIVRGVTAVFAELPWIYFESAEGTLVAALRESGADRAEVRLEAVRPSSADRRGAGGTVGRAARPHPGGRCRRPRRLRCPPLAARSIQARSDIVRTIPPGDTGLIAVSLDAAALAHSTGPARTFGDLRVSDAAGRQVPYLVERASEPLSIDLSIERLSQAPPRRCSRATAVRSVYRLTWPFDRLPSPRLVLTTSARVFSGESRSASSAKPTGTGAIRGSSRSHRRIGNTSIRSRRRRRWSLPLQVTGARELLVIVEEGDNSPLPLVVGAPPAAGVPAALVSRARRRAAARVRARRSLAAAVRSRAVGSAAARCRGRRSDR